MRVISIEITISTITMVNMKIQRVTSSTQLKEHRGTWRIENLMNLLIAWKSTQTVTPISNASL